MGEIHDLIESKGKFGAIEAGAPRDVIEAATLYMTDEDNALAFAKCLSEIMFLPGTVSAA